MFRLFVHGYWFVKFITVQHMICCLKCDFSNINHGDLKVFFYNKLVLVFNKWYLTMTYLRQNLQL